MKKKTLIIRHLLTTNVAPIIIFDVSPDFLQEMLDVVTVELIFRLVRLGRLSWTFDTTEHFGGGNNLIGFQFHGFRRRWRGQNSHLR